MRLSELVRQPQFFCKKLEIVRTYRILQYFIGVVRCFILNGDDRFSSK